MYSLTQSIETTSILRILIVEASPDFDVGNVDEPNGARDLGEIQIIEAPSPFGQDEGFGDQPSERLALRTLVA